MTRWWLGGCLLVLVGCGQADPPPTEDVLRLELGGDFRRLADALRAVDPRPEPAEPERAPPPAVKPRPESSPEAPPQAEPAERSVRLGPGQTIYGVAREHLGSGARWHEILELNGWTEARARRLRPGTRVVLPAH